MILRRIRSGIAAIALVTIAAAAQDPEWVETRFHRVHLKNGNFVDGRLVSQTSREVVLAIKAGQVTFRRDLVDRVEFIKMSSIAEKPAPIKPPTPEPAKPAEMGPEGPAAPGIDPEISQKIEEILARAMTAEGDSKSKILGEIRDLGENAVVWLAARLEKYDGRTLEDATGAIGHLRIPATLPHLLRHFTSNRPVVRANAVQATGLFGDLSAVETLRPMLEDPDSAVRIATVTALHWLAPKPSLPVIARRCADPSPEVRRRAFSVLFEIGDAHQMGDQVLSEINTVIDRAAADLKAKATESLGETCRKSAWMILSRLLEDRETAVRSAAAAALVSLAAPESGPMIVLRLRTENDKWTRLHLLTSARELKLMDAVEPLITWLGDPDPQIQHSALDALKRLTGMTLEMDPEAWAAGWRNRKPVQ